MALKTAIGLMSGTSMDGIDVALLKTDGLQMVERGPCAFFPYNTKTISLIKEALEHAKECDSRDDRPRNMASTETVITELHANAVIKFLAANEISPDEIDVLGFHGQTVLHRPEKAITIQLGDGKALAKATGIDTVYDMRSNDMQHGGQGAPLVPVYHNALAKNLPDEFKKLPVVFVNIGGISNITYIGERLIAFDTGPGNTLIDQWVQKHAGIPYDQGGMIANEGGVKMLLAEKYLKNQYFDSPLPKSLDRSDFLPPDEDEAGVEDGARTLAYVTAAAITKSVDHLPGTPKLWIVCGGGRNNPHIMNDLANLAAEQHSRVIAAEEAGFDGDAMEAECWAYLAVRNLQNLPLTFPETTGVREAVTGGILARA